MEDCTRLEERIRWLESLVETNPNPVIEMNAQGVVTFANEAAHKTLKTLGLPENPALFLPEDKEEILCLLRDGAELRVNRKIKLKDTCFSENIAFNREFGVVRIYAGEVSYDVTKQVASGR